MVVNRQSLLCDALTANDMRKGRHVQHELQRGPLLSVLLLGLTFALVFPKALESEDIGINKDTGDGIAEAAARNPAEPQTVYAGIWRAGARPNSEPGLDFTLSAGGAAAVTTAGSSENVRVGYAELVVNSGAVPYGTAVFRFQQNVEIEGDPTGPESEPVFQEVTVSEAGVPASPPTTSARIFIDRRTNAPALPGNQSAGTIDVNTGIAAVNYGPETANVTYTLRDMAGIILTTGHGTIEAGFHFAKFIDNLEDVAPDFLLPVDFPVTMEFGSLEISSDQPLSILALRGTVNQRNEFLMTTTPVADLTQPLGTDPAYLPQFVDGGGYTTSLYLVNTSGTTLTGTIEIMKDNGDPLVVTQADGATGSSFGYEIEPNGVCRFQTSGSPANWEQGWVRLKPDDGIPAPVGSGVFGYNPDNVLQTESGIPTVIATTHARIYVDLSQGYNTGLAIANINNSEMDVALNAYQPDGITPAGTRAGPLELAAHEHTAQFVDQLISELPVGFKGVLDISSETPFAILTVRSLVNERGDYLITTFPTADADRTAPYPIVFPQIADGGGYVTQFILLSADEESSVRLNLYDENGTPADVEFPPPLICNNNGTCNQGEDCMSCPNDCNGLTSGDPSEWFCCGADTCDELLCGSDCGSPISSTPYCGDGNTDYEIGEECDDGGESGDCDLDCTIRICGDGTVNITAGEECDDGAESETCDIDCTIPICGDDNLNPTAGEECDDGNTESGDGCSADCMLESPLIEVPSYQFNIGDSIGEGEAADGTIGSRNHGTVWSSGYDPNDSVDSLNERFEAGNAGEYYENNASRDPIFNRAVSGATMADFSAQAGSVVAAVSAGSLPDTAGMITILLGSNDVCAPSLETMTDPGLFESQYRAGLDILAQNVKTSTADIHVSGIPAIYWLWNAKRNNFACRVFVWPFVPCENLLDNPEDDCSSSASRLDPDTIREGDGPNCTRRKMFHAKIRDLYNPILRDVLQEYIDDGRLPNAYFIDIFDIHFEDSHVNNGDCFHPSETGHKLLSEEEWCRSQWSAGDHTCVP